MRGVSLASTLLLSAIAVTLAFTVAAVGFSHLSVSARLGNSQQARNLAEAAIARACEKIFQSDGKYGTAAGPPDCTINLTFGMPGVNEGQGLVTFDPAQATLLKIRRSTNNLKGKDPLAGDARMVPPQAVHLLGVGRCNGVERRIEAILSIPTYRHAITSSGPFASDGGLTIMGIDDPTDMADGIDPEEERAGNLASNGSGADAVKLDSQSDNKTRITGDVRSGGSVTMGDYTTVSGEIRAHAGNVAVPNLTVTDYDPGANAVDIGGMPQDGSGNPIPLVIKNMIKRRQGDLNCPEGVELNDGIVYVDGNVTIGKGIVGKGAIVATGNVSVAGDGALEGDKGVALLAGGDLSVTGTGKNSSYTQGIAYSAGNVTISDATFVGAVVANKADGSTVRVDRSRVVHSEKPIEMVFSLPYGCGSGQGYNIGKPDALELKDFFDDATNSFAVPGELDQPGGPQLVGGEYKISPHPGAPLEPIFHYTYQGDDLSRAEALALHSSLFGSTPPSFAELEQGAWNQAQLSGLKYAHDVWEKTKDETNKEGKFTLDPSRFLQLESKTAFTLWREY